MLLRIIRYEMLTSVAAPRRTKVLYSTENGVALGLWRLRWECLIEIGFACLRFRLSSSSLSHPPTIRHADRHFPSVCLLDGWCSWTGRAREGRQWKANDSEVRSQKSEVRSQKQAHPAQCPPCPPCSTRRLLRAAPPLLTW
jgi:hypothetical protein